MRLVSVRIAGYKRFEAPATLWVMSPLITSVRSSPSWLVFVPIVSLVSIYLMQSNLNQVWERR